MPLSITFFKDYMCFLLIFEPQEIFLFYNQGCFFFSLPSCGFYLEYN